jgi:NTE family protein
MLGSRCPSYLTAPAVCVNSSKFQQRPRIHLLSGGMAIGRKALVLGGGGVTGIAWETGLLAGLAQAGLDLTSADIVVGTSAGSVVGAQILSGAPLENLYDEQLKDATGEIAAKMGLGAMAYFAIGSLWPGDERRGRAWLGSKAIAARTVPESVRREVIEKRLQSRSWPARQLLIVAVDAETGEAKVFDRDAGASLTEAVAASCAVPMVWPPVTVNGRRFIDGGVRSAANADLATGCNRVVVLAPVMVALRRSHRIHAQLAALGPSVQSLVISPDSQARKAIGPNSLDPAFRAASAKAGRLQAARIADAVAAVWSPPEDC